jgi:regulator of replication initiation timing
MSDTQNNYGVQIEKLEWRIMELSKESEHLSKIAAHYLGESNVLRVKVAALEAEAERINAHTWEQERAAVVAWLRSAIAAGNGRVSYCIESGEHWPEGGAS